MCSGELTEGFIVGRAPGVKFKVRRDVAGDLGGVRITSGVFNHSASAFRCDSCGAVVVPPEHSD
jgi:uncharacterized OB-fold protein